MTTGSAGPRFQRGYPSFVACYELVTGHSVAQPPVATQIALKPPVETVALWSPRDGVIAPRSACGLPGERDRAVALRCSHIGFASSDEAIAAVAHELERG